MKAAISTVTATLLLSACGGGSSPSPTYPVLPTAPTTPAPGTTYWVVTQTFVSASGASNCLVAVEGERLSRTSFHDVPMTVTRSSGSITLQSLFFVVNYTGAFSGNNFSASAGGWDDAGGMVCNDGRLITQTEGVSTLSGRLSGDERVLTATEVKTNRLSTGELVTYTWEWRATQLQDP